MAKIHLSRIESSAFKISSYAGPSVISYEILEITGVMLRTLYSSNI